MNLNFDLSGKLALVTGGGTGLGFGISQAYVNAGANVVITGRRESVLKEAVSELGSRSHYIVNDITDLDSLPGLVEEIEKNYGAIGILVNNAGVNMKKHFLEMTDEEFQKILNTNVVGLYSLTREVASRMKEREEGAIINITSMAALYGISGVSAYSTSKTGVLGLTRQLAVDLSPHGIRVNAIAPGFIDSAMLRKAFNDDPERERRVMERTPMGQLGSREDVAGAALYLASDAAKFVTGINIPVDGGNSIGF